MPAPPPQVPKDGDIEANKAGKDQEQTDGGDSDCQIVDESPQEAQALKHLGTSHRALRDCGG